MDEFMEYLRQQTAAEEKISELENDGRRDEADFEDERERHIQTHKVNR